MRILIVSYYFPPYNSVGAVRPGKLAKFLSRRGHDVHVLSARGQSFPIGMPLEIAIDRIVYAEGWSANAPLQLLLGGRRRVEREGYAIGGFSPGNPSSLKRLYKALFHWPDAEIGWVSAACRAGRSMLSSQPYDLIYVSAPSFSGFRIGARLSKEFSIPWIAEFRDLWSDNHNFDMPLWRRVVDRRWESRLLESASAVVTVSAPLASKLARFGKPVWEIRNGFDPEDFLGIDEGTSEAADCLVIGYTGSVYGAHNDTSSFCNGLARFRSEGGRAIIKVVGRNVTPLVEAAREFKVDDWLRVQPTVPRREALALQKQSDVLLMFLWRQDGIYTTKLFEYAGAGRPILAIGDHDSDVGVLIKRSGIGDVAATPEEIAARLHVMTNMKQLRGKLSVLPAEGYDFSRLTQFEILESNVRSLILGDL